MQNWIELVKNVSTTMIQLKYVYVLKQKCFMETYELSQTVVVSLQLDN